nr:hypothetical protein [Tanacetum cinerariifolium]
DDCLKALKRVVNRVYKDKGRSPGADDDGFIKVKKKKLGGNIRGTKNFIPVLVKPKTIYHPKVNQPTKEVSPKMAPSVGKKKVSTTGNSSKKTGKTNVSTSSNGTFSLSSSFEVINVDNPITEVVDLGNKASMSEMDLFAFIHHVDPTKVRIGEREVREGEVMLLELTRDRVVRLAGVNDQGGVDVQGVVNEEGGDVVVADQIEESDHAIQDEGANIVRIEDEILVSATKRAKGSRKKRKGVGGASGSGLPPKKLKANHGTSGAGAVATLLFVTSFVTPTPERGGEGATNSITGPNLRTQLPAERFVISLDSSHHSSTNVADVDVSSVARSSTLDPLVMTMVVATTVVADTSFIHVCRASNELSIKATSLESKKDKLIDRVSTLKGTCSGFRDKVSGYKLFKEQFKKQIEAIQDEQILGRIVRLVVLKCLQSLEYLAALGGAISRAIDKGMHDGILAGIDHGKAKRETLEASQLKPSHEQLMLPVHQLEDQVVIRETSLSFSVDVAHARIQKIRGDVVSQQLSLSNALVPLLKPLSTENLVGEASTSGVLVAVTTTTLSTTFIQTSSDPSILVADDGVLGAEQPTGIPSPSRIVFEKEELGTTPKHTTAS